MVDIVKHSRILGIIGASVLAVAAGCSARQGDGSEGQAADLVTSPDLVISQVFGGGGNTGAPFKHDFVELFNRGSQPVSLGGKSLQYVSSGVAFKAAEDVVALPNVTLEPGRYFLVQLGTGGATGAALPAADLVTAGATAITMSKDKGKVALVLSSALLDGCGTAAAACTSGGWIDFVGYGAASQSETAPTAILSNTTAALRKGAGCNDTGNNSADFEVAAPAPRNAATAAAACPSSGDAGAVDAAPIDAASDGGSPADAAPNADAGAASPFVLLNEVKINPPGSTDAPWEYAEVLCTPGASLAGYYFVALEGDGDSSTGSPGVADLVVDLGAHSCGTNGIAYIKASAGGHPAQSAQSTVITSTALDTGSSPFENATTSFVIMKSPTPLTAGTDYDVEDDGILDLPSGASLVDGIAVFEQSDAAIDHTYAPRLTQSSGTPDGATRFLGNTTPLSASAWYGADIKGDVQSLSYDPAKASANFPSGAALTPGAPNSAGGATTADAGSSGDAGNSDVDAGTDDDGDDGSSGGSSGSSGGSSGTSGSSGGKKGTSTSPAPTTALPARSDCSAASGPVDARSGLFAMVSLALAFVSMKRRRSPR